MGLVMIMIVPPLAVEADGWLSPCQVAGSIEIARWHAPSAPSVPHNCQYHEVRGVQLGAKVTDGAT